MRFSRGVTRRQVAAGSGAAALSLIAPPRSATTAKKAASITIVINQSPWFDSFRRTEELYEKENGNKVELDVNPFAGSLENGAGSIRSPDHEQRLVYRNPGFKLDSDIYTLDNTVYFDVAKKGDGAERQADLGPDRTADSPALLPGRSL
jgi:multiple sugar transport system substrate-binding protein